MRGRGAPNAGRWAAVKLYDYPPGTQLNETQISRGAATLGVSRQRKQKSLCAPL